MRKIRIQYAVLLFLSLTMPIASATETPKPPKVVAVFAHPDDETWMNGTLAKLVKSGVDVFVVYVTSGSEKRLLSKMMLGSNDENPIREQEAINAYRAIELKNPPIFLQYAHYNPEQQYIESREKLYVLLSELKPDVVISFGPDGVTGHLEHVVTGLATSRAVDRLEKVALYLQIAVSQSRASILNKLADQYNIKYKVDGPVEDGGISLKVNVADYFNERVQMVSSHPSQFSKTLIDGFQYFIKVAPYEEFVIARNRRGDRFLEWFR